MCVLFLRRGLSVVQAIAGRDTISTMGNIPIETDYRVSLLQ